MKIAVLGGGITGLTACMFLSKIKKVKKENIHLFTLDVGGEFGNGGLKYLKVTDLTQSFVNTIVDIKYKIKTTPAALYYKDSIENFPLFMYQNTEIGKSIQKHHWGKTRGEEKFDERCMNDVWNFKQELKFDFEDDFLSALKKEILSDRICEIIFGKLTNNNFEYIFNLGYDLIIYTLPLNIIGTMVGVNHKMKESNERLTVYKFKASKELLNQIWYDYIYFPQSYYKFHRISKTKLGFDVEVNGNNINFRELQNQVNSFFINNYCQQVDYIGNNTLKGHIKSYPKQDVVDKIPDNVVLLGRYAEFNSRITWDKVVEKLYKMK